MSSLVKFSEPEICYDFGQKPILFARISADPMVVGVGTFLGSWVMLAIGGVPALALLLFASANDIKYVIGGEQEQQARGKAVIREIRDLTDDAIEVAPPIDPVKAMGNDLFPRLPSAKKLEIAAMAKAEGARPALLKLMADYGLTDAEVERDWPGALAILKPKAVAPASTPIGQAVRTDQAIQLSIPQINQSSALDMVSSEPFQSLAVMGGQRCGKTYLLALVTSKLKREVGTKIIYINLYDPNGDAADDWGHADVCVTGHLRKMGEYASKALIEKTTAVINEFAHDLNAIVVFDEWVQFTHISNGWSKKVGQEIQQAKAFASKGEGYEPEGLGHSATELMNAVCGISGELSNIGKKQLKAIHLVAPNFVAGNVEQQGKVMKSLKPMIVAIPPGKSVSWTHPKIAITQEITFDAAGYEVSHPNFPIPHPSAVPALDCDRMVYFNGQWLSLDGLPQLPKSAKAAPSIVPVTQADPDPWEAAEATTKAASPSDTLAKLSAAGITIEDLKALLSNVQ